MKDTGSFQILDNDEKQMVLESRFINNFKDIYVPKYDYESVMSIIENSMKILEKSIDIKNNLKNNTGIAIGKVQSGKTSNFLSLISLAFDNNYDISIIIGGKDKDLLSQNEERLKEVFETGSIKPYSFVTSTINNFNGYSIENLERILEEGNKKLIITSLKHGKGHLEKIFELFNESSIFKNKKVLIIDDEGDQGTLNANYNTKKEVASSYYSLIINLKNILLQHTYISITATPYANLLINTFDLLSPDFIKLIYPSKSYTGLLEFHGINSYKYIRIIPDLEEETLSENTESNKIPSFQKALSTFIVSSAFVESEFNIPEKFEMLVHSDRKISEHSKIYDTLNSQMEHLRNLANASYDDIRQDELVEFLNDGFLDFFNKTININNEFDKKLLEIIKKRIKQTVVKVINGSKEFKNQRNRDSAFLNYIYIGADLLERGITIENLLVTYITRRAKKSNADTGLQRARWFGYRHKYLKFMKIFCTEIISDDFKEILKMEEDLWFDLSHIENGTITIKDWERSFSLNRQNMGPTRKTVAKFKPDTAILWNIQETYQKNTDIEEQEHNKFLIDAVDNQYDNVFHKELEFNNLNEFEDYFINSYINIIEKCNISLDLWKILKTEYTNVPIKIIKIRPNQPNGYRTTKDGKISLFSGQRQNNNLYKGDRYLIDYSINKSKIILEIYELEIYKFNNSLKDNKGEIINPKSLFYALYIPGKGAIRYVSNES